MDTATARRIFAHDRYAALAGIDIVEAGKGYCKARMEIGEQHLNSADVVHGGAIFTLADLAFAVASNSHGQLALAVNAQITYLRAVSGGVLEAVATEVAEPTRLGVYEAVVSDGEGRLVARFNGMVYRKNEPLKYPG